MNTVLLPSVEEMLPEKYLFPPNLPLRTSKQDSKDPDPPVKPKASSGKRHTCKICHKSFNRPASLKIHLNTHTGKTPYRCPWLECGREFNVNSNMRRHYRGHLVLPTEM